ncbi:MAG: hypothetical protein DMG90_21065 [Acidobacteria bacterium]|nr:MAG: hypothetical protein DMG90_21065 [Acidobacteriota bacterium]
MAFLRLVLRILMAGVVGAIAFFALFIPSIIVGEWQILTEAFVVLPLCLISAIAVGAFSLRKLHHYQNLEGVA